MSRPRERCTESSEIGWGKPPVSLIPGRPSVEPVAPDAALPAADRVHTSALGTRQERYASTRHVVRPLGPPGIVHGPRFESDPRQDRVPHQAAELRLF
jgi:hypothetical protein